MNVVECCWACHGTGYHVKSVQPIRFKPCWMCYGRRGRTADLSALSAKFEKDEKNAPEK